MRVTAKPSQPAASIFRPVALQRYQERQTKATPRLPAVLPVWACWLLLTTLLAALLMLIRQAEIPFLLGPVTGAEG